MVKGRKIITHLARRSVRTASWLFAVKTEESLPSQEKFNKKALLGYNDMWDTASREYKENRLEKRLSAFKAILKCSRLPALSHHGSKNRLSHPQGLSITGHQNGLSKPYTLLPSVPFHYSGHEAALILLSDKGSHTDKRPVPCV